MSGAGALQRELQHEDQKNLDCTIFLCGTRRDTAPAPSPAEVSIRKAPEEIAKQPEHYPFYKALAMAYSRRAREASDVSY